MPRQAWAFADCRTHPVPRHARSHAVLPQGRLRPVEAVRAGLHGKGSARARRSVWPRRATSCRSSATPRQMPPARQTRSPAWSRTRSPSGTRSPAISSRRSSTSASTRTSRSASCGTACFRASPRGRRRSTSDSRCRAARHALRAWQRAGRLVGPLQDKARGRRAASLLDRCAATHTCPKVIEAFGSTEFWGLRMSPGLIGTDAAHDIPLPDNVRRYYYPGTTHGGGRGGFRVRRRRTGFGGCTLAANPNPEADTTRALTAALIEWVVKGTPPPPSRYPRLDRGELVAATKAAARISGLAGPQLQGFARQSGSRLRLRSRLFVANDMSGVISLQPPRIRRVIPTLRAEGERRRQRDRRRAVGAAPGAARHLSRLESDRSRVFRRTGLRIRRRIRAVREDGGRERRPTHDPRLSVEERYGTLEGYVCVVEHAARQAVGERFLLKDDADRLVREARASGVLPAEAESTDADREIGRRSL